MVNQNHLILLSFGKRGIQPGNAVVESIMLVDNPA